MSANQSNLSSPQYGYDFVVATTQASINTGLKEYLYSVQEPEVILCYVADQNGDPTILITLAELLARTNNISPFDIPDGTPQTDLRVDAMRNALFRVAVRIRLGLPPGVAPTALPPVVTLGASADKVQFNTLCAELQITQLLFGPAGSTKLAWNNWKQPSGESWHFGSTVDLVNADLDKELDTPYFNSHPAERQALLNQLENLGSNTFGLQQLLFDLDSAVLESTPQIEGFDFGSPAGGVLKQVFVGTYFAQMKQNGGPVLAVQAVSSSPDDSSLQLTSFERQVVPPLDADGNVLPNPTPAQAEAATLTFLCAANKHALPPSSPFTWNWAETTDLDGLDGVIAINRNTLAAYYRDKLLPLVSSSCIKSNMRVEPISGGMEFDYQFQLIPGDTPQSVVITDTYPEDPIVLTIHYESVAGDHTEDVLGFMIEFNMHNYYTCTVAFSDDTITIVQGLQVNLAFRNGSAYFQGNVVDRTITDTFVLSVGQDGNVVTTATSATKRNDVPPPSFSVAIAPTDNPNIAFEVADYAYQTASLSLKPIPAQDIQSFVFPGGKVFTYKDIRFSKYQDLVSSVTYVAPDAAALTPHRTGVPVL